MKNYFKLTFISFLILFFSNTAFSDTTYFIDFSKVLNQSKAGKQAQNILKKRLEDSVSKFNKEEKNLRDEEKKLITERKNLSNEDYQKKVEVLKKVKV